MASKIKKALKKIGKAALVAGAGYAAMKGLGKRKAKADLASTEDGKGGISSPSVQSVKNRMTSDRAYKSGGYKDSIMSGGKGNMYEDKYKGTPLRRLQKKSEGMDGISDPMYAAKGGRAGYKSGGKTKPKSIGKALRGGGKVMR
mgnify:FL=1|jgi:hypothetical protein